MERRAKLGVAVAAALVLGATWAVSAPQPRIVPTDWVVRSRIQAPQSIRVKLPGQREAQTFWYVLYTVTNKTGATRVFVPDFTLYADSGQILGAADVVSPSVFEAIQNRHNNPLLKVRSDITGDLLEGEDNAKDGVAIFRDVDPTARRLDLFVGGLTGESAEVKLPVKVMLDQPDLEGRTTKVLTQTIVLHKALQLRYRLPGGPVAHVDVRPRLDLRRWIMR